MSVYDVSREETFDSLRRWYEEINQYSMNGGKDIVKILVGNKIDQPRVVSQESAAELAQSLGMIYREASVKNKEGVTEVLKELVEKVSCFLSVCKGCSLCSLTAYSSDIGVPRVVGKYAAFEAGDTE